MVQGIDHIQLIVRDVEAHVGFFQELGFRGADPAPRRLDGAPGSPAPASPSSMVHQVSGDENIGVNHIALRVANAQEAYEELQGKGVAMDGEPHFSPPTGRTNINLRDHDG